MKHLLITFLTLATLANGFSQKIERLVANKIVVDYTHIDKDNNLYFCGSEKQELTKFNADNELQWRVTPWGPSTVEQKSTVTTDSEGNVYWAGDFHMPTDFDFSAEEDIHRPDHWEFSHSFIIKLDENGNQIWRKIYESAEEGHTNINNIQIDENDKLYIFGTSQKGLNLDNEIGLETYSGGAFVTQLDTNGNEIWTNYINNTTMSGHHYYLGTTQNGFEYHNGNLYLTSETGSVGTYTKNNQLETYSTNGSHDVLTAKIDTTGQWQWVNVFGGTSEDKGYGLAIDEEENVYFTGYFTEEVDFDPSDNIYKLTSENWATMFLQKVNSDGNFIWVKGINTDKRVGGYSSYNAYDVTVTDNNTVIVGGEQLNNTIDVFDQDTSYRVFGGQGSTLHWIEFYENGDFRSKNRLLNGMMAFTGMNFQNGHLQIWGQNNQPKDFDFSDSVAQSGDVNNYRNAFFVAYDLGYTYHNVHECDSFYFNNEWRTTSGEYIHQITDEFGNDSISTVYLTLGKTVFNEVDVFISEGEDFVYDNWSNIQENIRKDTTTTFPFTKSDGCDSIVTFNFIMDKKANGGTSCETAPIITDTGYYSVTHHRSQEVGWPNNAYYQFVPEVSGIFTVSSLNTAFEDTELYVYDECGGTILGYSDDDGGVDGYQSEVILEAEAGDTLLIEWTSEYWDDWHLDHYTFEIRLQSDEWPTENEDEPQDTITSIISVNTTFDVYPNPTTGSLHFQTTSSESIELYNTQGELLITTKESMLDVSKFDSGIYFLKQGTFTQKVIKQ